MNSVEERIHQVDIVDCFPILLPLDSSNVDEDIHLAPACSSAEVDISHLTEVLAALVPTLLPVSSLPHIALPSTDLDEGNFLETYGDRPGHLGKP